MLYLNRTLTALKTTGKIILNFLGFGIISFIYATMLAIAIILGPFEYIITGDVKFLKTPNAFCNYCMECLYKKLWD